MKKLIVLTALALCATGAFAALSPEFEGWAKGPAQHLMTKEEVAVWKSIATDDAAKEFVALFWSRRDPSPATPRNELREEFDRRVAYADEHFTTEKKAAGSVTDRGKALILFGAPRKIERTGTQRASSMPTGISDDPANNPATENNEAHTWTYDGDDAKALFGSAKVTLRFIDRFGNSEFKLDRAGTGEVTRAQQVAVRRAITQPDLTKAPSFVAAAPVPAAPEVPAVVTALTTESLATAVTGFKAAAKNPYEKAVFANWGEFVTTEGETFVPVMLYVPKAAGLGADASVTFFGQFEDASGANALAFEDEVKLNASRDDFFVDKSLTLGAGKYKGYLGLAVAGQPVAMTTVEMDVAGKLDKDATAVSPMILSNNVYPLLEAQSATDPFAFGGIKVVPKADRTFRQADELWYFFELRNPGLPEAPAPAPVAEPAAPAAPAATGTPVATAPAAEPAAEALPKIQVKIDVEGMTTTGQKSKKSAPPMEIQALAMKGVPGHYGVGNAIPLQTFKPGDYTFTVKVIDTVKKASYTFSEKFKIVE